MPTTLLQKTALLCACIALCGQVHGSISNTTFPSSTLLEGGDLEVDLCSVQYHRAQGFLERETPDFEQAIHWLRKAAKGNHAIAAYQLAIFYTKGWGVEKNRSRSLFWLKKSASFEYPPACHDLAMRYFRGDGVLVNGEKGMRLMETAMLNGFAPAFLFLGRAYLHLAPTPPGYDPWVPYDPGIGMAYLDMASTSNMTEAWLQQGVLLLGQTDLQGIEPDPTKALTLLQQAAQAGEPRAMALMGMFYHTGTLVDEDKAKGTDFYRRGAEIGDVRSTLFYAAMLRAGEGVERNPEKAQELLDKLELKEKKDSETE
jgi:TPR repeat protein